MTNGVQSFQGRNKQHDYCNNDIYNDVVDSKLILTHQSCCCLYEDDGKMCEAACHRMLEKFVVL